MKVRKIFHLVVLFALMLQGLSSCKREVDPGKLQLDPTNKTILGYLQANPSYSILVKALDTTQLSATLNLYGTITLFAPTDDAFKKYFTRRNISGLSQMNLDTLTHLLKYHLYSQQFPSSTFQSGSLPSPTVEGSYIRMDISKGLKNVLLNNTVKVDTVNIPATNGIIHVINDVLEPPSQTLKEWINSQPNYSIMAEAFRRTGVDTAILGKINYDSSSNGNGQKAIRYKTLFIESNDVLKSAQINSFDDLAKKFSNSYYTTKAYTNPNDSLNIFLRYHIIDRRYFLSDVREDFLETFNKGNYLIFTTVPSISINKNVTQNIIPNPATGNNDTTYTTTEVKLDFDKSNQVTKNGIINSITSVMSVFTPRPIKVVEYMFGAPEDRTITLPDGTVTTFGESFDKLKNDPNLQTATWWFKSEIPTGTGVWVSNYGRVCGDYIMRVLTTSTPYWMEITTKPIFKGTYNVFIVGPGSTGQILTYWDGVPLGGIHDMNTGKNSYGDAPETWPPCGLQAMRVGTVKLTENGPHKLKIQTVTTATSIYWYQIALVPVP
jgi:uncharacterized surface protein with fasciclin (FAS1) repeats